jgi:xylan 1,4-beta-xylosidase
LNSSGFDPSLFHDDDGRRYLVNMLWDFTGAFVGMACQDPAGTARPADFDWFDYRGRESVVDPTVVD